MGQLPLFAAAPRIKIRLDNEIVGFAIGMNINFSVDVQPMYTLGEYGAQSLETVMYSPVTGTLQIQRLRPGQTNDFDPSAYRKAITTQSGEVTTAELNSNESPPNSLTSSAKFARHIDPRLLLFSETFEFDVYMKIPVSADDANGTYVLKEVAWLSIKNCRFTSRNTNIAMGQIVNEPFNFMGLLATPIDVNGDDLFAPDSAVKNT